MNNVKNCRFFLIKSRFRGFKSNIHSSAWIGKGFNVSDGGSAGAVFGKERYEKVLNYYKYDPETFPLFLAVGSVFFFFGYWVTRMITTVSDGKHILLPVLYTILFISR